MISGRDGAPETRNSIHVITYRQDYLHDLHSMAATCACRVALICRACRYGAVAQRLPLRARGTTLAACDGRGTPWHRSTGRERLVCVAKEGR